MKQMSSAAIELSGICCRFGKQTVLHDLSLRIRSGETVAIIGESGCGKSVTMKVMMRLQMPTSGALKWFGREVESLSAAERQSQRLRLGYLFQGAALFDSLTVYENIAFGLRHNGEAEEPQIQEIVSERLEEVGLSTDVAAKRPSELSGGMQKRVGLARALALSPDVMFYDEPTTGLDPVNCRRIDDLILSVRKSRGVTGIIVTHDLRTVQRVADRIIMLYPRSKLSPNESQLIFDGTLDDLSRSQEARVHEYIGDELNSSGGAQANSDQLATDIRQSVESSAA